MLMCAILMTSSHSEGPLFHVPFNVGNGGCCADINAIGTYKGVAHLFKQSGGLPGALGFAHYVSTDFVNWVNLRTIIQPGALDGSVNFRLKSGPVILWDCGTIGECTAAAPSPPPSPSPSPSPSQHLSHTPPSDHGNDARSSLRSTRRRPNSGVLLGGCKSGDAAIIGVARPVEIPFLSQPRICSRTLMVLHQCSLGGTV